MRSRIILQLTGLAAFFATPALAQFGIAGKRKAKTSFEEMQDKAKQEGEATIGTDGMAAMGGGGAAGMDGMADLMGGASMENLQKMMADAMNDPETRKQLGDQMGGDFVDVFDKIQNMSPEDLQKQMEEAMNLLSGDSSMIDSVLEKREEIIDQIEKTGGVPPEELARFKADPEYFELKMRESFDQMQGLMSDPEYVQKATEALGAMGNLNPKDLFGNSDELTGILKESLNDDDKLEEARLEVLKGDNPLLSKLFEADEMQEILKDPVKWRETVKEGYQELLKTE